MAEDLKFRVLASVVGAQAIDDLRGKVNGLSAAGRSAVTAAKGLAAAFAVKEVASFVKGLIDLGDELDALSQRTGISVKDLSGFKVAAEKADLPFEGLVGSLKKFSINLGQVKAGNDDLSAALRAVGVSAVDANGNLRPTGEVIKSIADRFANLKDGPEKAALAVKLFGKSGTDIIPFLNQGSEALGKFSLAIGDDFSARADQFNDSLTDLGVKFQNAGIAGANELLPTLQEIVTVLSETDTETEGVISVFEFLGEAIRLVTIGLVTFKEALVNGVDFIVTIGRAAISGLTDAFNDLVDSFKNKGAQLKALVTADFDEIARLEKEREAQTLANQKKTLAEREKLFDEFAKRSNARLDSIINTGGKLGRNSLLFGEGSLDEIRRRQREETKPAPRATGGSTPDVAGLDTARVKKLEEEIKAAKAYQETQLDGIEIEKLKAESYNYSGAELQKLIDQKKIDMDVTKATKNFTADGAAAYREAAEAVKEQRAALIDLQEEQRRSVSVGAKQAFREYIEGAQDVAKQTKDAFTSAFKGLEDALVDFVSTGKLNFKDLASSILADIARIAIRQSIIAPILGAVSGAFSGGTGAAGGAAPIRATPFANGGIMTALGSVPLRKYASGGVANSPQLALYGEGARPEAYVPLPDGRRIPVAMEGGGGMNVNVVVNVESGSEKVESSGSSAKQLGILISNAVKAELVQQKRPGGLLA